MATISVDHDLDGPTISADHDLDVTWDGPTKIAFSFPQYYSGVIVLGDIPCPYDVDSSVSLPANAGLLGEEGMPITICFTETTRVRVYFYQQYLDNGNWRTTGRLLEYQEFTVKVNSLPYVTVLDYGNSASFEESTIIKIKTNRPGSLWYKLLNLDRGLKVETTITIDESLSYTIPITDSCNLWLKFTANGKSTQELFYFFKKELFANRSIYSTKLVGNTLLNNFDNIIYPGMSGFDTTIDDGSSNTGLPG